MNEKGKTNKENELITKKENKTFVSKMNEVKAGQEEINKELALVKKAIIPIASQNKDLITENKRKQTIINKLEDQIEKDKKETKRLAEAFSTAENDYSTQRLNYLYLLFCTFIIFLFTAVGFYFHSINNQISWITRINITTIFALMSFMLFFFNKQYYIYRNLYIDMKHRKTLAQSYYNILRSADDESIRPHLAKKVIEYITTPPQMREDKIRTPLSKDH